ncbi:MAG TPA: hypothetical protein VN884_06460 [Candidatus Sulfotelmatobacter sp.]|nr:hypothetical protein [Candidatus Sulfotelmatobacter sp.]
MQPALQTEQGPVIDAFPGNVFEIKIPALGAVSKPLKNGCNTPGVKSVVASVASPGTQANRRQSVIQRSVAMRLKAIRAPALRTNHCVELPPARPQNT